MEEKQEARKVRRIFTPEQKFEILKDIQRCATIKEGLERHRIAHSLYLKWKRQLVPSDSTGLRASELMLQIAFQTTFVFPLPRGFWTLSALAAYTCVPTPGERRDLPAAHALTARLAALF